MTVVNSRSTSSSGGQPHGIQFYHVIQLLLPNPFGIYILGTGLKISRDELPAEKDVMRYALSCLLLRRNLFLS